MQIRLNDIAGCLITDHHTLLVLNSRDAWTPSIEIIGRIENTISLVLYVADHHTSFTNFQYAIPLEIRKFHFYRILKVNPYVVIQFLANRPNADMRSNLGLFRLSVDSPTIVIFLYEPDLYERSADQQLQTLVRTPRTVDGASARRRCFLVSYNIIMVFKI